MRLQVDEPEPPEILPGLQLTVSPAEGEVEVERLTVPVKPFWAETVAVKEPVVPDLRATLEGFLVRLKSGEGGVDWWNRQPVTGWISQPLKLCQRWLS